MFKKYRKYAKWGLSTFGVALFYIFGMLFFRETHPFSRFPMYSSFPNWAYSFYIANKTNRVIPLSSVDTDGVALGHLYGSVAGELNISYGNFMESEDDLRKIGDRMMEIVLESRDSSEAGLRLYRKAFYYNKDSITEQTDLMTTYENH